MDNYTPNTDVVRLLYAIGQGGLSDDVEDTRAEDFDRWLEGVRAEERERIAQALARELGDGRAADIARRGT